MIFGLIFIFFLGCVTFCFMVFILAALAIFGVAAVWSFGAKTSFILGGLVGLVVYVSITFILGMLFAIQRLIKERDELKEKLEKIESLQSKKNEQKLELAKVEKVEKIDSIKLEIRKCGKCQEIKLCGPFKHCTTTQKFDHAVGSRLMANGWVCKDCHSNFILDREPCPLQPFFLLKTSDVN